SPVSLVGAAGADRAYAMTVPAGQTVRVKVSPTAFDVSLFMFEGSGFPCGPDVPSCVASSYQSATGPVVETLVFWNQSVADKSYTVVVDGRGDTAAGGYAVAASLYGTPAVTAAGDTCATAPVLTPPAVVRGSTASLASNYTGGTGCPAPSGLSGRDGVYA